MGLIPQEVIDDMRSSIKSSSNNVDRAEAIVRALGLSDFEIFALAQRLSIDDDE